MAPRIPSLTLPFVAAAAALSSLVAAACASHVDSAGLSTTGTTGGTTTTTGAGGSGSGGGSQGACAAPLVPRSEGGACLGGVDYGVDEGNPLCCRPCGPSEAAEDTPTGPLCVRVDAGTEAGDGGTTCPTYTKADKACATADDCATVALGCFCGAQPIVGVAKALAAKAAACEADAAARCALGCANMPGHVAEDGKGDQDGGTIAVACDQGECRTVLQ